MMRKLLEAMTRFAGQPEQKPGEQWKGTDKGTPGKKLVGDSIIKDLSKGPTPKTKEEELAEAYANFNEDDLGVEEKRPHRTGSRADRVGVRGHKEQPRYTKVTDEVDEATAAGLKVGDHVTANTSKGEYPGGHKSRAGKVTRVGQTGVHIRPDDGGEEEYHPYKIVKKTVKDIDVYEAVEELDELSKDTLGNYVKAAAHDVEKQHMIRKQEQRRKEFSANDDDKSNANIKNSSLRATKRYAGINKAVNKLTSETMSNPGLETLASKLRAARTGKPSNPGLEKLAHEKAKSKYLNKEETELDEGAADVYSITSERNGRERSKSGTLAELIEYYGYTLATGKSYEHERGNRKINLNPKSIESLVQNLNNAKSNAAANGQSNERFYVDHGNMVEADMFKAGQRAIKNIKSAEQQRKAEANKMAQAQAHIDADKENERDRFSQEELYPSDDSHDVEEGKHFRTAYGWAGGRNEKTGRMYKHPDQIKADREAKKTLKAQQSNDAMNSMFGGNPWIAESGDDENQQKTLPGIDTPYQSVSQQINLNPSVKVKLLTRTTSGKITVSSGVIPQANGDILVKGTTTNLSVTPNRKNLWVIVIGANQQVKNKHVGRLDNAELAAVMFNLGTNGILQNKQVNPLKENNPAVKKYTGEQLDRMVAHLAQHMGMSPAQIRKQYVEPMLNDGRIELVNSDDVDKGNNPWVAEGWESGPEEVTTHERDPDAEYDAHRQEKLDAKADRAPKTKSYQCVGRGHGGKPNHTFGPEFSTQEEAITYRKKLMANPKTPNPDDIGIRTISRVAKGINEDVSSTDPLEGALLNAIEELVSQGHKDVDPMVLTNMVVAATSRPFLLKDLVDANNNSQAVQHYIDSISPSKVKFSTDTLTVKNEDPGKDKAKSQAGVRLMASRAKNRNRLGEGNARNIVVIDKDNKIIKGNFVDTNTASTWLAGQKKKGIKTAGYKIANRTSQAFDPAYGNKPLSEGGGQSVVHKQDVRLVKDVTEAVSPGVDTVASIKKLWQYIGRNLDYLASMAAFYEKNYQKPYIEDRLNTLLTTADGQPMTIGFNNGGKIEVENGVLYIPVGTMWRFRHMFTGQQFVQQVSIALGGSTIKEAQDSRKFSQSAPSEKESSADSRATSDKMFNYTGKNAKVKDFVRTSKAANPHTSNDTEAAIAAMADMEVRQNAALASAQRVNDQQEVAISNLNKAVSQSQKDYSAQEKRFQELTAKIRDQGGIVNARQVHQANMAAELEKQNQMQPPTHQIEGRETPLQDKNDYNAKHKALQDMQLDPDTNKDPQLKAELARRLSILNQQYSTLQEQITKFKESRGHKAIATKLDNIDRMNTVQIPTPAERREQIRIAKEKEQNGKKPIKEFAVPGANPATPVATAKPAVDPAAVAKATAATNTLKAAVGGTPAMDQALAKAAGGTATSTDVKALAPALTALDQATEDPKLASMLAPGLKTAIARAKTTL